MKFLIDAQLPRRMVDWLSNTGNDAVHTLDMLDGNRTTDKQIIEGAEREQRAVVTKDADFVNTEFRAQRVNQGLQDKVTPYGISRNRCTVWAFVITILDTIHLLTKSAKK